MFVIPTLSTLASITGQSMLELFRSECGSVFLLLR
jgi:hypothetical protein